MIVWCNANMWMGHCFVLACTAVLTMGTVRAQGRIVPPEVNENPSARFMRDGLGDPQPLANLPAKIQAGDGKITLWADFEAGHETGVPLYLINKTNAPTSFSVQDKAPYIKLEYKDEDGLWTRAQAHVSSWCGNSYYHVPLPPQQFFVFRGYRAAAGVKRTVRYADSKSEVLTSNSGEGLVSDADLKAVSLDDLTIGEMPDAVLEALIIDERQGRLCASQERIEAIRSMILFPKNEAVLRVVRDVREWVRPVINFPMRDEVLGAIDDTLAYQWPAKGPAQPALQVCIDRIVSPAATGNVISEAFAWRLIGDLLAWPQRHSIPPSMKDPGKWTKLIPAAVKASKAGNPAFGQGPESVLKSEWIINPTARKEK